MRIVLATNNAHKREEFIEAFSPYGIEVLSLKEAGIEADPEETGRTFRENAEIKAETIGALTDDVVIADDSGLEIHALDGFPGIYSARFMEGCPYIEKFRAIESMLEGKNRDANFNCTLCVVHLKEKPIFFEGKAFGTIVARPEGKEGFGYDPIFFYPPKGKTFAEMTQKEKNEISHRGNAIRKLMNYLKEENYL